MKLYITKDAMGRTDIFLSKPVYCDGEWDSPLAAHPEGGLVAELGTTDVELGLQKGDCLLVERPIPEPVYTIPHLEWIPPVHHLSPWEAHLADGSRYEVLMMDLSGWDVHYVDSYTTRKRLKFDLPSRPAAMEWAEEHWTNYMKSLLKPHESDACA